MANLRKSLRLRGDDRQALVNLYFAFNIAIDNYKALPEKLWELAEKFNDLTGRTDRPCDILHYMLTQRKRGLWVRLANPQPKPPNPVLTAEHVEVLVNIYHDHICVVLQGSDTLAFDEEMSALIARQFLEETGVIRPAHELVSVLIDLRKRGLLHKVKDAKNERADDGNDEGFNDIDQVRDSL